MGNPEVGYSPDNNQERLSMTDELLEKTIKALESGEPISEEDRRIMLLGLERNKNRNIRQMEAISKLESDNFRLREELEKIRQAEYDKEMGARAQVFEARKNAVKDLSEEDQELLRLGRIKEGLEKGHAQVLNLSDMVRAEHLSQEDLEEIAKIRKRIDGISQ